MASPNTLRRSQIASRLGESRLEALLESAELLHATLRLEDLLRHLLRTIMGRLLVGRAGRRHPSGRGHARGASPWRRVLTSRKRV